MVAKADAVADPGAVVVELHHATTRHGPTVPPPVAEATVLRARREIQAALPTHSAAANVPVEQDGARNARVGRQKRALASRGGQVWP